MGFHFWKAHIYLLAVCSSTTFSSDYHVTTNITRLLLKFHNCENDIQIHVKMKRNTFMTLYAKCATGPMQDLLTYSKLAAITRTIRFVCIIHSIYFYNHEIKLIWSLSIYSTFTMNIESFDVGKWDLIYLICKKRFFPYGN